MTPASKKRIPSEVGRMTKAAIQAVIKRSFQAVGFAIPVLMGWWSEPWIDLTAPTPLLLLAAIVVASLLAGSWWALAVFPVGYVGAVFMRLVLDGQNWKRLGDFIATWDGSQLGLALELVEKAVAVAIFVGFVSVLGTGALMAGPIAAGIWLRSRITDLSSLRQLSYRD